MTFLIEYDRSKGTTLRFESFEDKDRKVAEALRLQIELELSREKIDHEVVLLEAPNKEALRRTHRRYFENVEQFMQSSISSPILSDRSK